MPCPGQGYSEPQQARSTTGNWTVFSSICSTYGHLMRGPTLLADVTCSQCYSSETAILYSSNEKEFKLINYLINNKYGGSTG